MSEGHPQYTGEYKRKPLSKEAKKQRAKTSENNRKKKERKKAKDAKRLAEYRAKQGK